MFSCLGFPKSIRADNGRQFVSSEFKEFCNIHNIKLIHTPPYWPQANGEVENMSNSILKRLQIAHANGKDYQVELQKFLLMYNVTPHGSTGKSPSELLLGRNIRDKIPSITDLITTEGDMEAKDSDIIEKQKRKDREDKARGAKSSDIQPGDKVITQNMTASNKSRFGKDEYKVAERNGNELTLERDGRTFKRHTTHVKKLPRSPKQIEDCNTRTVTDAGSYEGAQYEEGQLEDNENLELKTQKLKLKKDGLWRSEPIGEERG
ncbi:uncharacterized protein K02A2.6-like [Hylaeus volcanicus]|uniref:uncharacterized protein K02A2.6-like n=1 Tax=Hylaeus volcanicus TaxID=313075 RepID=UPI0023B816C8|nr:uncharacterized protein K02A2.6-like [Hylaeus volcanicus]